MGGLKLDEAIRCTFGRPKAKEPPPGPMPNRCPRCAAVFRGYAGEQGCCSWGCEQALRRARAERATDEAWEKNR